MFSVASKEFLYRQILSIAVARISFLVTEFSPGPQATGLHVAPMKCFFPCKMTYSSQLRYLPPIAGAFDTWCDIGDSCRAAGKSRRSLSFRPTRGRHFRDITHAFMRRIGPTTYARQDISIESKLLGENLRIGAAQTCAALFRSLYIARLTRSGVIN